MSSEASLSTFKLLKTDRLVVQADESALQPTHHLWNNRGTWWCHLTVRRACGQDQRLRFSLKTKIQDVAIERRDKVRRALAQQQGTVVVGNSPAAVQYRERKKKP
ncbi:hypothetical protein AAFN60_02005 [Roseibacillus persicicus]|uniref:hypothetical protein n=1 Tax=Roseibacillus persicicus TaxID=454148 RepID=UPI00398AC772